MVEQIISILKQQQIDIYCINEIQKESFELFFIKQQLDMTRSKNVKQVKVTIYRDFMEEDVKYRGSVDIFIYPNHTPDEIEQAIIQGYENALFIKNPFFEIPQGIKEDKGVIHSTLSDNSLSENAYKMAEALYQGKGPKDTLVNSSEIYGKKETIRIIHSSDCDISYTKYYLEGEFVVQFKNKLQDVELYQQFSFDELATEELKKQCEDALISVRDRGLATQAPEDISKYPIILCDDYVREFLGFYLTKTNTAMIYPGYSSYMPGHVIQDQPEGEFLNLTMLAKVPFSEEGVEMGTHSLIEKGIVKNVHGKNSFCAYMKVKEIGTYSKLKCENGTMSLEDMKKQPYILIKSFSDFQIDAMDGHFGGEYRLAYFYDGETVQIITGGTLSMDIYQAQKNMMFSKETYHTADYEGPRAVLLRTS